MFLSDDQIKALIEEPKDFGVTIHDALAMEPKKHSMGHSENMLEITGQNGGVFSLILRQAIENPLDFSIILGYTLPEGGKMFRLKRYNGNSHEHSNPLEKQKFSGRFHIHTATERYQQQPKRTEDRYAEPTDRYADIAGALQCAAEDCRITFAVDSQMRLF